MTLRFFAIWLVSSLASLISFAQVAAAPNYVAVRHIALKEWFHTKSNWSVTAYQVIEQDSTFGDVPAKVCFSRSGKPDDCIFITSRAEDETLVLNHQTVEELKIVPLTSKENGVLLSAQFFGGGSGTLNQIAVWSYERAGDYFLRILTLSLTEQGTHKLITSGPLEGDALSADAIWGNGESHFGAHRYEITVNRYIGKAPRGRILQYVTRRKYPGADSNAAEVDVISQELPRITALLKNLYRN